MRHPKQIIGFLLTLILMTQISAPMTYAAEMTKPELACQDKKPDSNQDKILDFEEVMKVWSEAPVKDQNAYQLAFEAAQLTYHDYIGCMFDFAEGTLLKTDGSPAKISPGGFPILSTLIDWMSPSQACLTSEELKKIVQSTDPSQMLNPVLEAYSAYRDHLNKLGKEFDDGGLTTDDQGKPLSQLEMLKAKSAQQGTIKRQRKQEIESSLLAIDMMFSSLKELRLSLVMHVQFQCTLQYLEKYRTALGDLRTVIEALPSLLEDASVAR